MKRNPSSTTSATPDAVRSRAVALLEQARSRAGDRWIEVYLREARRVRVSSGRGGVVREVQSGHDRGLAMRVAEPAGRRVGFAATSGWDEGAAAWVLARASDDVWAELEPEATMGEGLVVADHASDIELPKEDALVAWIGTRSKGASACWVEAATVVEAVVSSSGTAATRARRRLWAGRSTEVPWIPDAAERPTIAIGRALEDLDPSFSRWPASPGRTAARLGSRPRSLDLVIDPQAAAPVIAALAATLFGPDGRAGLPAGAGLFLLDDPLHSLAVLGGRFDDTGHLTGPVVLADGNVSCGRLSGQGRRWRPSYRDYPAERGSTLVVSDRNAIEDPAEAYRVVGLRVVPVGPEVVHLEVDGFRTVGGDAAEVFVGASIRTRPEEFLAAIAATTGRAACHVEGVVTPSLVVRGLNLEV